jgi:hypothetical protein
MANVSEPLLKHRECRQAKRLIGLNQKVCSWVEVQALTFTWINSRWREMIYQITLHLSEFYPFYTESFALN